MLIQIVRVISISPAPNSRIKDDFWKKCVIDAVAEEQNIIDIPLAQDAIRLIENGSVDAWVYNEIAGKQAIDLFAADPDWFVIGKELVKSRYYFAFHPDTPVEFVNAVNSTLWELKRDRSETGVTEYERIIAQYLPVQCANQSTNRERVMELVNQTAEAIALMLWEQLFRLTLEKARTGTLLTRICIPLSLTLM